MLDFIPTMALAAGAILVGFGGLIWSADRFVAGAAGIASNLGIAPIIIGLTVVSFGTSAPEVMVSLIAALDGSGELAVGNALGSNIANIGLVLGVTALVAFVPVQKHILKDELPMLMLISLIAGFFLADSRLSGVEGWILLGLLLPAVWYLVRAKQTQFSEIEIAEEEERIPPVAGSTRRSLIWFVLGLIALIASSKVLVWGAVQTANYFQVSALIIGLTVIAIGTSLPELAASVMSALRGHHDIAVGNIVGSNLFNLLAVMSIPGIVGSASLGSEVFWRDFGAMLAMTLLLCAAVIAGFWCRRGPGIGRSAGIIMLLGYGGYIYLLASVSMANPVGS